MQDLEDISEDEDKPANAAADYKVLYRSLLELYGEEFKPAAPHSPQSQFSRKKSKKQSAFIKMKLSISAKKALARIDDWLRERRQAVKTTFSFPPARLASKAGMWYETGEALGLGVPVSSQGNFSGIVDSSRRHALNSAKVMWSIHRVDPSQECLQQTLGPVGSANHSSIRYLDDQEAPLVLFSDSRPSSSSRGCLSAGLVPSQPVCIPAVQDCQQGTSEVRLSQRDTVDVGCSPLTRERRVHRGTAMAGRRSQDSSSTSLPPTKTRGSPTTVLLPSPGQGSNSSRHLLHGLDRDRHLCVPPVQDYQPSHQEIRSPRGRENDLDSSILASKRMIHRGGGDVSGLSEKPSSKSKSSQTAPLREVSSKPPRSTTDCLQTIEKLVRARGFSTQAARAIAGARRVSSQRVYQSKWETFRSWCKQRKVSSITTSVSQIANFLLFLRQNSKLAVSTIKGYRSTLSSVVRHRGIDLTQDRDLKDLLKSFETTKQTQLRLPAWNLDVVLKFLCSRKFEPISQATLREVTKKTLFLMALATAKGVGEIHAIEKQVGFNQDGAVCALRIDFLSKNENPSKPWPGTFEVPNLTNMVGQEEERLLCPVRALRAYLSRTKRLRGASSSLWCSVKDPQKPLSKNALSFFLRETIREAHLFCEEKNFGLLKVKAHEVRAVATSLAYRKNMSVKQIMDATFWRSNSVFASHYLREVRVDYEKCYTLGPYVGTASVLGKGVTTSPQT
ncbi:uncharacterized protein [Palaemon carinicauda]|uniref:uncharacterized protein n=1 Tax=Palaemon carinicauda TaxID=392227 RepID=UPI0035B5C5C0